MTVNKDLNINQKKKKRKKFGKMSVRGNVTTETVRRGNGFWGNCPFRDLFLDELSMEYLSVGELSSGNLPYCKSPSRKCSSGKCQSGN